jgi:hypothetical protein
VVDLAVGSPWLNWPPELSNADRRAIVTTPLGESRVLVTKNCDVQFAHGTTREYLAAYNVVRRHVNGRR